MGTYLSKPVTTKKSDDAENDSLAYGASCMQGWRESQEDAHNCILDFDKDRDISLFAVYDGHGGAEVAKYAAINLPEMVKNNMYKDGEYEKALVLAYLNFDDSLVREEIVEKLAALREEATEVESETESNDEPTEKEDELNELYHEANMPIEDLLLKYKNKVLEHINKKHQDKDQPGSSKTESEEPCSSSGSGKEDDGTIKIANGDEGSSVSKVNGAGTTIDKENKTGSSILDGSDPECGPSGSKIQNGDKKIEIASLVCEDDSEDDSEDDIFHPKSDDDSDGSDDANSVDDEDEDEDDEDCEEEEDELDFGDEDETPGKDSGCTAVMALISKNKLYVANAGDSRCVISVGGKAHDMSKDHKPEDEPEYSRICAAGGKVSSDGRVNGGLNLSRALGDHNYKQNSSLPNTKQQITAFPDVCVHDIKPEEDSFVVLACDGIWNSLSSQEVVDFVSERINKPDIKLSTICEELFETCLAPNTLSDGTGCDNMTCVIVKIKHNQKRPRSDEEDKSDEGNEKKKHKSDSIEQESVQ